MSNENGQNQYSLLVNRYKVKRMKRALRIFLKVLKYVGITLLVLIVILAGILWWGSIDKIDKYYIPKTDFRADALSIDRIFTKEATQVAKLNFEKLSEPYFMSNYHWLKEGDKTAIVFRTYSAGLIFVMDDERFTQLTVVVPKIEDGSFQIDGKQLRAFYTSGGSAWPDGQCGSSIENGTLKISNVRNGKFTAQIDFDVVCKNKLFNRENQISFHQENDFKELPFADAKAWHGKKGDHIYRETYR